jgi:lysozyme family protein
MAEPSDFNIAFELTVGHEGGYSNNPDDPGNWTGGDVGEGQLKGTKYGVSGLS